MSQYRQSYSAQVAASPEACFAVLTDFDAYPRWSSPVKSTRVLERRPDGLARRVDFVLDMTVRTVHYVLEYDYDPPHGASWRLVEGDLAGVDGSYRFTPEGEGTRATCEQAIDLGFWVPGFLRSTFERKALRDSVEEFRRAVESRATAGRA
ncbi:MAG TPA: SRPBCC family protein [Candidatus Binatia bacterium]|nr:SRPBCC family protein [Candidatus Binatia bacterium]